MYMGEERRVGQRVAVLIAPSALWGGLSFTISASVSRLSY